MGEVLLWIIGTGLIGYIAWVIIKSVFNTSNLGKSVSGMITRIGYIIGAGIYGGLALNAFQIAMHAGSGERNAEQTMSAMLLRQPFGPWLVSGIGAIIVGYGLFELYSGMTKKFLGKFNLQKMNEHERKVAEKSGKTGLISRGVVLALIGTFFIQTALSSNPGEAKGLDGALAEVSQQPFGQWLLGITALGLTLYGVYEITRGRYERMSFGK
ncbi:DUF1206 domain-containing protein [Halobacillus andaensis]|uniref:DUF1206 domain-containing protein n=1 Tax=Halobacillus andaensis TaxID=1176239 RepID=UPI003D709900